MSSERHAENQWSKIDRVFRTRKQVQKSYDRLSHIYDLITGGIENKYRNKLLENLKIIESETVLEVGFGTGSSICRIPFLTGNSGNVFGLDLSPGMLNKTRKKIIKRGLEDQIKLICGDVLKMPFKDSKFDAVIMNFTLELFDTPELLPVLKEIQRVLKPGGRLGLVSLSKEIGSTSMIRVYEWAHNRIPSVFDCRPIFAEAAVREASYRIVYKENSSMFGLGIELLIAQFEKGLKQMY